MGLNLNLTDVFSIATVLGRGVAGSPGGGSTGPAATDAPFRNVSTRTTIASGTQSGQVACTGYHYARDDITGLKLTFGHLRNDGTVEQSGSAGTAILNVAIEYPLGTYTRVLWSGSATASIAAGTQLESDLLAISIPNGSKYGVCVFQNGGVPQIVANIDRALGEKCKQAASGLTDETLTNWTDAAANFMIRPHKILSRSFKRSIGVIGDSVGAGTRGSLGGYDSYVDVGSVSGFIGGSYGYVNMTRANDTMANFVVGRPKTVNALKECTDIVIQLGSNDAQVASRTLAQMQADTATIAALFDPTVRIWLTTKWPRTTSTNNWTTTANQTVVTGEAVRLSFNAWVRSSPSGYAGYFELADPWETSRDSGWWANDGVTANKYTPDGVHANDVGYALLRASNAIPVSTFSTAPSDSTPAAFSFTPVVDAYPSTVYTSNAITVGSIDQPAAISITGGTYSVNGGAYVSTGGYVNRFDAVTVQLTAAATFGSTVTTATLTIGGVSANYVLTTPAAAMTITSLGTPISLGTSATTIVFTTSTAVAAGQSIVLQGTSGSAPSAGTDTAGNAYTFQSRNDGGSLNTWIGDCLNPLALAAGSTITVTIPSAATRSLSAYKLNKTAVLDTSNNLRGTTSTSTARSVAPLGTPTLNSALFTTVMETTNSTTTWAEAPPASPWTTGLHDSISNGRKLHANRVCDGTGITTLTLTPNNAGTWSSVVRSYK